MNLQTKTADGESRAACFIPSTTRCMCLSPRLSLWYTFEFLYYMSSIVRKRDYCLCENKGADQLRGNREADQRLCFRYTDSTIPLLLKSEISSF